MKKNVTMITLLLLIAGILSGCGNKPNEDLQNESVQTAEPEAEPGTENPSAEPETEESQHKFDVEQDVLLSYEYDSNGEISKVIFKYDLFGERDPIYEFTEFETTYDIGGRLESIETNFLKDHFITGALSIKSDYNADGQIVFLTVTYLRDMRDDEYIYKEIYNYEVVYNSHDDCIKVYISHQKDSDADEVNETRTFDSNRNLISVESFSFQASDRIYIRTYEEYANGILSHSYKYDDSTGYLREEMIYHDNGNRSEMYMYDSSTGELLKHYRFDRDGIRME